jgi:hypothetical protein
MLSIPVDDSRMKTDLMHILRVIAFSLFLAQFVCAEQPAPILPDPNLTPVGRGGRLPTIKA